MLTSATSSLDGDSQQSVESLIRINIDSRDGYRDAARHLADSATCDLLHSVAEHRAWNANVLRDVLDLHQCSQTQPGTMLAHVDRVWATLRATISIEIAAILNEAVAAEEDVRLAYIKALSRVRARGLRQLLQEQLRDLGHDASRLKLLRDQTAATS